MGKIERNLTVATASIVFAAGLYVVIFAPLMVNERDDGSYYITDYSFTKGINEARILADNICNDKGQIASDFTRKKTYKRASNQFGTEYRFTCQ